MTPSQSNENDLKKSDENVIRCRGIRTHNLKNLNVDIPLGKWVAVTGVSGSGKSSLAFDTLFAESQRRFLETLGTYERQFLEGLPEGEFDSIDQIPPAVALKQTNRASDPRSLVATTADLSEPLRTLFAALMEKACLHCGTPVILHTAADLESDLRHHLHTPTTERVYLTLPLLLPLATGEKRGLLQSLRSEGYHRLLIGQDEFDISTLLSQESLDFSNVNIILDRLTQDVDNDEIRNRVATAWSQVRYSPRFHTILVIPQGAPATSFSTQPICPQCNSTTRILQVSDLDWESVLGHCTTCSGLGNVARVDRSKVVPNTALSIAAGAIKPWTTPTFAWMQEALCVELKQNKIDAKIPFHDLPPEVVEWIWSGEDTTQRFVARHPDTVFIGEFFHYLEQERYKSSSRILLAKYRHYLLCPDCHGERLSPSGRNARCEGIRFPELMQLETKDLISWIDKVKKNPIHSPRLARLPEALAEVERKLALLNDLGLGSCALWRRCKTLSGGEFQRVLLSRVVGNGLTDALYVLDEPSVGLGETEIPKLIGVVRQLRDLGNTVLMVDHDPALVAAADTWIELGPGGGQNGGYILPHSGTQPLSTKAASPKIKATLPKSTEPEKLHLLGFSALHCRDIDIEIPLGRLTIITGPSGAGKTTLLRMGLSAALEKAEDFGVFTSESPDLDKGVGTWRLLQIPNRTKGAYTLVTVDQKPLQRSITSVVTTVLGIMDTLRTQLAQTQDAKLRGLTASHFSFNSEGACPTCDGRGTIAEDLFFLGQVDKICPDCRGSRFLAKSFLAQWEGRTIHDWLQTSIDEALQSPLKDLAGARALDIASRLGLGYLSLGMATTTLSGGEAQRLRIAGALTKGRKPLICLLDEPSRGLSETDVSRLLGTLLDLTSQGHTFVVVEHHPSFRKFAHHVIHMGPGGGKEGGKIVNIETGVSA